MRASGILFLLLVALTLPLAGCTFQLIEADTSPQADGPYIATSPEDIIGTWYTPGDTFWDPVRFGDDGKWYFVYPTGEALGGDFWFEDGKFHTTDAADITSQAGIYVVEMREEDGQTTLAFEVVEEPVGGREGYFQLGLSQDEE